VIYIDDHLQQLDTDHAMMLLSDQRREYAMRYRFDLGRRTCIAAYLLLCRALNEEYGITGKPVFAFSEHGKPSIIGHEDIHFNFSHCSEAAICAVSTKPIGVDIETPRHPKPAFIDYTMNGSEVERIRKAHDPSMLFTQLWTMKEALVKLTANGITNNLRDVLCRDDVAFSTIVTPRYIYTICQYKN
jgi:4'-phosphopantetheinyl transferase